MTAMATSPLSAEARPKSRRNYHQARCDSNDGALKLENSDISRVLFGGALFVGGPAACALIGSTYASYSR